MLPTNKLKQNISILGCGWLGLELARELVQWGYFVKGSTRSLQKLQIIQQIGAKPYQVTIHDQSTSWTEFLESEILIITMPPREVAIFEHFILQIQKITTIQKVVFISSTAVYPFSNGQVTERSPIKLTPLTTIESLFRKNSNFKTTILRFGGLYGPDRHPGNFIKQDRILEHPEGFVNLIHRDDCIGIIKQLLATNTWNETFNACADAHPMRREFYTKQAHLLEKTTPVFNENAAPLFKIISSEKLKTMLNYTFKYGELGS